MASGRNISSGVMAAHNRPKSFATKGKGWPVQQDFGPFLDRLTEPEHIFNLLVFLACLLVYHGSKRVGAWSWKGLGAVAEAISGSGDKHLSDLGKKIMAKLRGPLVLHSKTRSMKADNLVFAFFEAGMSTASVLKSIVTDPGGLEIHRMLPAWELRRLSKEANRLLADLFAQENARERAAMAELVG